MVSKIQSQVTNKAAKVLIGAMPKDASATAALNKLGRENTKAGSISGKEMADTILAATKDPDGQAAGKEYAAIKKWVGANGNKLSPEAKKVFEVYSRYCERARSAGETGIDFRSYGKMSRDMQAASKPGYKDASSAQQLNELAKDNTKPGSISGREMAAAILNGTKDLDGHSASKEFADISKFVKENEQLLSPEAKKVFDVYAKAAKAAGGNGGIAQDAYNRMARDMMRAGEAKYSDKSAGAQLNALAQGNTKPGSISGKEMMDAIVKGTADLDAHSAKQEFADIAKFVKENEQLLSPEAKKVFDVYSKAAHAAQAKGNSGIDLKSFMKMQVDMQKVAGPAYADKSMGASLQALAKDNTKPGSISGRELTQAILKGAADPDNMAAGKEFADVAKFVKENEHLLSPEAKKAFQVYAGYARTAQARGETGIRPFDFARMRMDMQRVGGPVYGDQSAAKALEGLAKDNKVPGSISGREMMDAIVNGTKDLDNQAAGKEFADIAKFVKENEQLLSPQAKQAFAIYEKHVKAAQAKGQTGISLPDYARMQGEMARATRPPILNLGAASQLGSIGQASPSPASVGAQNVGAAISNALNDLQSMLGGLGNLGQGHGATGVALDNMNQLANLGAALEQALTEAAKAVFDNLNKALENTPALGTPGGPQTVEDLFKRLGQELEKLLGAQPKPPPTLPPPPFFPRPDASAAAAVKDLAANNTKPGSISGKEMTEAIIKGTHDLDNQAAGKEFAEFSKFVKQNEKLLSPEAKKVFAAYEQHARAAQARGQSGIPLGDYMQMQMEMRSAAAPVYADKGAGAQLEGLAKDNKKPGSISGKEMVDAIIKGTADLDGQAAGKEFADISKFVRENEQLLSPEAKQAFSIYEKHAKAAQARGQTGIDQRDFFRMQTELQGASRPHYRDASAAQALGNLARNNQGAGSISGRELVDAIVNGTKDLDAQAAGREFADISKFVKENEKLLSPEAKKAFAVYEKHAKAAQAKGQTGIDARDFMRMQTEMRMVSAPGYKDTGASAAINSLAAKNTKPGSISGKEMADAIMKGTADFDGQAAGREFGDFAKFVRENDKLLSPEAKKAFAVYEKHARAAQARGETGLSAAEMKKIQQEMANAYAPRR